MKANELRIGNIIDCGNGYSGAVTDICKNGQMRTEGGEGFETEFKGMPLTEDWLKKLGFAKQRNEAKGISVWDEFFIGNFLIGNHGVGFVPYHFCHDGIVKELKFIHELQNLYFALTGKHLIISEK